MCGLHRIAATAFAVFCFASIALSQGQLIYPTPQCPSTGIQQYPNDNCQLFYSCNSGVLTVLTCPFGEAFDRLLSRCRPAFLVDCAVIPPVPRTTPRSATPPLSRPTTTPSPTTTTCKTTTRATTTTPRTTRTTPTTTTTTTTTTPRPRTCPPTGTRLVPTGDCVTYYNCTNGRLETDTCPSGDLFDPTLLQCVPFYDVTCMPVTTTARPTTTQKSPVQCPPTGTKVVPTGDCVTYYLCSNGQYTVQSCQPGDLLDPSTLTCQPFYSTTCYPVTTASPVPSTTKAAVTCPPQGSQTIPTGDCVTYYQCSNGRATLETCPSGDLLDPTTLQCLPFYQVSCTPINT